MVKWNPKCRFFDERYACDTLTTEGYESCGECKFWEEWSKKILIIKFGALGDVIRTTTILPAIRKKYGNNVLIYWMTNTESVDLLKDNPFIDKILPYNLENVLRIQQEQFDILFSLEINTPATLLANLVKAYEKYGYYFDNGATSCFNLGAEEYLETAFLNTKKLQNRKTYQQLIFQASDLLYEKEFPIIKIHENKKDFAEKFKIKNNTRESDRIIGIHVGADSRWQSKSWSNDKIIEFIKAVQGEYKIILLGGPSETEKIQNLRQKLLQQGKDILTNDPSNTYSEFAALLNICGTVITHDTFPLHMAIALKKPTIALFFSTPPWEIEDYGTVKKITSPLLEKYFFINEYIPELAESISVDSVINALDELNNKNK